MRIVETSSPNFKKILAAILDRGRRIDSKVAATVSRIIRDVAGNGDTALFKYTKKFDGIDLTGNSVEVSRTELRKLIRQVPERDLYVLRKAAERICEFHGRQVPKSWSMRKGGAKLGQKVIPLKRVGIYVPGGSASYPSTVLMAAIPARVAGVKEILMATPGRALDPMVIAAADLGGVKKIFRIGGAQAIAAMAYGTESIPPVDKIVGPGNAYVAAAKKMVFGDVGIDMIAGPSEIIIIADQTAQPSQVAADLLSQAEHDEMSSAVLLTADRKLAARVGSAIKAQISSLQRKKIASESLEKFGAIIVTADLAEAVEIANSIAPEHLEIMTENPEQLLAQVRNAGCAFLGKYSPEALGDYIAGPNHILPTGGTARFSSPLGVYDFVKRMNFVSFSEGAFNRLGKLAADFAALEGLQAHSRSIKARWEKIP